MHADVQQYVLWAWSAVGIVWLIGALTAKHAARTEPAASRLGHMAIMVPSYALLFSSRLRIGPLAWRFLPDSAEIAWAGLVMTVAGCAFAIWARLLLGGNWSASVTVKQDHRLIRRGPYTLVRHPIYTGFLLGMLGTAIAVGELGGLLGLVLAFMGWRTKSRLEEAFMIDQFGEEYTRYRHEVKALIPFVL